MRTGIDDGGVLMLAHDGQSWVMRTLAGTVAYRAADISADDHAAACAWAHRVVAELAGAHPPKPANSIPGVRCYTLHERSDGSIQVGLSPGRLHHDGQSWVLVDPAGEIVHRSTGLGPQDDAEAERWAKEAAASRRPRLRPWWGVQVGRFPDGSYFDYHGRLRWQRARQWWNRLTRV